MLGMCAWECVGSYFFSMHRVFPSLSNHHWDDLVIMGSRSGSCNVV